MVAVNIWRPGDADYADRGGITSDSTCTYADAPEPCVPSCEGGIIGQFGDASALDDRTEWVAILAILRSSIERASPQQTSTFKPLAFAQF